MSVRLKLLGGVLAIAAMMVVTGLVLLRADDQSARRAAVITAEQVAAGLAKDVAYGLVPSGEAGTSVPLYDDPTALRAYVQRMHKLQDRDIVVLDTSRMVLADAEPGDDGTTYAWDGGEVRLTILDQKPREFIEHSNDSGPVGIREVVVPLIDSSDVTLGAVIYEYTPTYDQMVAMTDRAERQITIIGAICILAVLVLGAVVAESISRRIRRLTRAVEVVRDGDFSQRVVTGGRDEIGQLGTAFNDMAFRLEQSAREILAREYTDRILANAGEGICGVDAAGRFTFANEAAGRITGLGVEGLLTRYAGALLPSAGDLTADGLEREVTLDRADGTSVRVAYTVSTIQAGDRLIGAVIVLRDVTRQRALEHDLRHQALHDALTGLPNRKLFLDRLEHAMTRARESGEPVGVLYLDLDGFKKVNDSLGHNAGDQLLRTTAERLQAVLRPHDTVARLGGDEFAVLIEGTSSLQSVVDDLLAALSKPFRLHEREATVSASVGVVPDAARYADADEVVRNADVAMYAAKAGGKARHQVFESRMHEQLLDRLDQENRLREAVHRGELRLHLQPVVEIPTRRLAGVEALVRWEDPERGLQQPGAFIPLAEETGLITEIDRWVLREACQAVRDWQDASPGTAPAWVSVNLSAANLDVPDLTDRVAYALAGSGLSPRCLVLELTETMLMRDIAVTAQRLDELRELGVQIAIDDFGTGYSSLGYLRDIPVDVLKVDRSFIVGLATSPRQQELVSAVVQLGHTLGLKVVAEGIEEEDQLAALEAMGCRYAQGYYLGRPVPAAVLTQASLSR
ncbi:EAL domain-containing protein [Actinoplanes sp. NPDC051343]|uniref:EAL domain-containing protein n=1 Tax=Actinoplanes sp. NPDC051343 TaxID=3363906 RepID=UPI00378B3645